MSYLPLDLLIILGLSIICAEDFFDEQHNLLDHDPAGLSSTVDASIPVGKCEDMNQNTSLRLSNVGLRKISAGFIYSPRITCLSLDGNQITNLVPGAFDNLPNLMYLDLSRNQIPTNELMPVDTFEKLTTLVLDENSPSIPINLHHGQSLEVAGYFPQLKYLYLRKNKITKILPRFAENLPNLTHLFLADNAIGKRISDFENNLPNSVTHVYLQHNEIEHIDDWQLLYLKFLFLDGNKIRMLCYKTCGEFSLSLKFAWKLETLSISHNDLETIESDTFDDTVNLLSLDLSHNAIQTIREGTFGQTMRLVNLFLDHNLLTSIPDLSTMYNITNLHLNDNYIRYISSGAFSNLSYLTNVTLNNNLIEHVEPLAFSNLPMLMELDLSNNSLHRLPLNWMLPQMNLRNLYLNMNKFESLDEIAFTDVISLLGLHINDNPLKYLTIKSFEYLPENTILYIQRECKEPKPVCIWKDEECDTHCRHLYQPYYHGR